MILSRFLNDHFDQLNDRQQVLFEQLLEIADPQLADWFNNKEKPNDQGMAEIVETILSTH